VAQKERLEGGRTITDQTVFLLGLLGETGTSEETRTVIPTEERKKTRNFSWYKDGVIGKKNNLRRGGKTSIAIGGL